MRVLPLALWHQGPVSELVTLAHRQSLPTHAHPISQVCCAIYCAWARYLASGRAVEPAFDLAVADCREVYQQLPEHRTALEREVLTFGQPGGSGYVVDSLHSSRHALSQANGYASAVRAAVSLGQDTDTTAAITGGLAGLIWGETSLPTAWLSALGDMETALEVIRGFNGAR